MTVAPSGLPSWDDLPVRPDAPPHSSWGLWGDDDVLGCLNLLTSERVRAGIATVERGDVFNLNLDLALPSPPFFGRSSLVHLVRDSAVGHDDEIGAFDTQSSSQWDGFRHVRHDLFGFYNGIADASHGVHHWAARGLVGRAVLADVGRWRESVGRPLRADAPDPIEPSDLEATLDAQGTTVETGDILLIRTGWLTWYRSLDTSGREAAARRRVPDACGLRPGSATARLLWDLHIAAVAADNPGLEVMPPGYALTADEIARLRAHPVDAGEFFLHLSLLPLLGLPIGELFDLDALADDCAADGRYICLLTSAPLNLRAGVASPPNALAVK